MDHNRRSGRDAQASGRDRNITSPRRDSSSRISKSSRPRDAPRHQQKSKYLTQDEQNDKYAADEDKFVLKQSKKKADIRVREGRAKPIDNMAFNLKYVDPERDALDEEEGDESIELPKSVDTMIEELDLPSLKELQTDIDSYLALETHRKNRKYWRALETLCADCRARMDGDGHEGRIIRTIGDDINRILSPKTYEELENLEDMIKNKIREDEDIDTDYWGEMLRSIKVWKAKATLSNIQQEIKTAREERLRKRGGSSATASRGADGVSAAASVSHSAVDSAHAPGGNAANTPGTGNVDVSSATNALYDREVARGVNENEEVFAAEETLPSAEPQWKDTYRPRKPRYFNRVQMGYEWNKYNQTHYDHDNPPPKVVQGYKFNIFYPELIDKTKAPTFKIIREGGRKRGESFAAAGEDDTCLIRFTAGPPYEDIAFRIVDREWDYSAKRDRGYRSSFDKGILQLHFQFKRIFYRK